MTHRNVYVATALWGCLVTLVGCNQDKWGPPTGNPPEHTSRLSNELSDAPVTVRTNSASESPSAAPIDSTEHDTPPEIEGTPAPGDMSLVQKDSKTGGGLKHRVTLEPPNPPSLDPALTATEPRLQPPPPTKIPLSKPKRYPELTDRHQRKLRELKERRTLKDQLRAGPNCAVIDFPPHPAVPSVHFTMFPSYPPGLTSKKLLA